VVLLLAPALLRIRICSLDVALDSLLVPVLVQVVLLVVELLLIMVVVVNILVVLGVVLKILLVVVWESLFAVKKSQPPVLLLVFLRV
jgi:hypothetical protein